MGRPKFVATRWVSRLLAGVALTVLGVRAEATVLVLDDFNVGKTTAQATYATTTDLATGLPPQQVVGGERELLISNAGLSGAISAHFQPPHLLAFGSLFSVTSFRVEWDGSDAGAIAVNGSQLNPTGLAGLDLWTNVDWKAMLITVVSAQNAPMLTLEVYTDATRWSYVDLLLPTISTPTVIAVPYAKFVQGGGAGAVNWANLGAIVLKGSVNSTGLGYSTFSLSNLSVPEPSTLALFAVGVLALARRTARRRS